MTSRNTKIRKLVMEEFKGLEESEKKLIKRFLKFMKKNGVELIVRDRGGFEMIRGDGLIFP